MVSPRMNPFPPVELGGVRVLVDRDRPVARIQSGDSERFVTWPEAPLPPTTASAHLVVAADAIWVVYAEEEPSESTALPWSTVVRIGADGSAVGIDIGRLAIIGADAAGVWASPRPWTSPEDLDDDEMQPPSLEEYADLPLESRDEFAEREEAWHDDESAALRSRSLDVGRPASGDAETEYGWFASVNGMAAIDPPERLAAPPPPGPSPAVELVRFAADGGVERLMADRTVMAIEQEGPLTVFTYFPTNPVGTLHGSVGGISYSYPLSRIAVDLTSGLPPALAVGDYDETPLPADHWSSEWADEASAAEAPHDIDLSGVGGITWHRAPIDAEEQAATVHRIVEQLEGLAEPSVVWTRRDDRVHRVESPYRELSVDVSGSWPETVVTIEFRNRDYSDALFRRRYRVFDATGRPIPREYVTVYLEEDLATGDHPEPRDGVIEFPEG